MPGNTQPMGLSKLAGRSCFVRTAQGWSSSKQVKRNARDDEGSDRSDAAVKLVSGWQRLKETRSGSEVVEAGG